MKICSKEPACHCSAKSALRNKSSCSSRDIVWAVLARRISETPRNAGVLPSIIQALGDIETSQSVNAYNASTVWSTETPAGNWISISTRSAVLSTTFRILILPLSLALRIESIIPPVVVPKGISRMMRAFLSFSSIRARQRIFPPRLPSW